jgi:BirA family biotin operon repressor/biotin-[acetyl-CoA-carboxylase] ligase
MRDKILKLLKENEFISGEFLANKLNVSRTAIWKQINSLKKKGYKIVSIKNKGYCLISRPDVPIPEEITKDLNTKIIGKNIHYCDEVTSTNFVAKKLIKKDVPEGTVIVADIQTRGRGRKNRTWSSPLGGLWISVILYPDIPLERAMLVTMTASIAVAQGIKDIVGIKTTIKWPNDVLIDGKKVCGILTELDAEIDKINYSIVGIGLNVNNEIVGDLKKKAISIKQKVEKKISRVTLLRSILSYFDIYYTKLTNGNTDDIRNIWFLYSNIIGRDIVVNNEKEKITGKVVEVDNNGCLILNTHKGNIRIVSGDLNYL